MRLRLRLPSVRIRPGAGLIRSVRLIRRRRIRLVIRNLVCLRIRWRDTSARSSICLRADFHASRRAKREIEGRRMRGYDRCWGGYSRGSFRIEANVSNSVRSFTCYFTWRFRCHLRWLLSNNIIRVSEHYAAPLELPLVASIPQHFDTTSLLHYPYKGHLEDACTDAQLDPRHGW